MDQKYVCNICNLLPKEENKDVMPKDCLRIALDSIKAHFLDIRKENESLKRQVRELSRVIGTAVITKKADPNYHTFLLYDDKYNVQNKEAEDNIDGNKTVENGDDDDNDEKNDGDDDDDDDDNGGDGDDSDDSNSDDNSLQTPLICVIRKSSKQCVFLNKTEVMPVFKYCVSVAKKHFDNDNGRVTTLYDNNTCNENDVLNHSKIKRERDVENNENQAAAAPNSPQSPVLEISYTPTNTPPFNRKSSKLARSGVRHALDDYSNIQRKDNPDEDDFNGGLFDKAFEPAENAGEAVNDVDMCIYNKKAKYSENQNVAESFNDEQKAKATDIKVEKNKNKTATSQQSQGGSDPLLQFYQQQHLKRLKRKRRNNITAGDNRNKKLPEPRSKTPEGFWNPLMKSMHESSSHSLLNDNK